MGDDWEDVDSGTGFVKDDDNQDNFNEDDKPRYEGGRGGGRGRGRGSGGGRGGGGRSYQDRNGDDENSDRREGGGRGRGRGRGGGRGGGRSENRDSNENGGDENNENGEAGFNDEKPKEFYIPPEPSNDETEIFGQGISSGINFEKYDSIPVKVTGEDIPPPIISFEDAGLNAFLLENVKKSGYTRPTPIQKTAISVIMNKRDLMGCAQTGSGKTAAFLLPIINDLLTNNLDMMTGQPHVVIMSPTRELAIQIYNEARKFALGSYLKLCLSYGGTSTRHQSSNLAKGCHILVATPGRLMDFVKRDYVRFSDVKFFVLDEADRMLDLGFLKSIEEIMNHPSMVATTERQTLMFSATFPSAIQDLAVKFLNNYIFITVGIVGGACKDVTQNVVEVKRLEKREKILELLNDVGPAGTMVFVETKRQADFLASFLSENKLPTTSIHGDRLQSQREEALHDFKTEKMKILVATSVAARGLDIKNVKHVINYDMPKDVDEYVHRIGRTGRVGNAGKATTFFDPEHDSNTAENLVKLLTDADQEVPEFLKSVSNGGYGGGGDGFGGQDIREGGEVQNGGAAAEDDWD